MSREDVINKVIEIKEFCVKNQDYEAASELRDIENAFTNSKHSKIHIEPTIENLKIELLNTLKYLNNDKSQSVRHIKLLLLLNEF